MSEVPGLGEGIEAMRVMLQGAEIFLRVSGGVVNWSVDKIAKVTALLVRHCQKKKSEMKEGEINFKDLIAKGGSVGMMQIEYEHFDVFEKYAKDMGLSYSIMPDINKQDIYLEVAYPENQGEAFRYFISQHPDVSKSYTYGEYFDNANPVDMEAEIRGLGREAVQFAEELKAKEMQETISVPLDTSLMKKSAYDGWMLLAVPNTENEYIRIANDQLTERDGTYMMRLAPNGTYYLFDEKEEALRDQQDYRLITGKDYQTALAKMQVTTELNRKKKEDLKGTVKLVNREADGTVKTGILKNRGAGNAPKLEELLDKVQAQKGR